MKSLLYKEWKLALHPAAVLFLLLSAMMLIPNYPYYVAFFYTTLGLFFICLNGREYHDIDYSMTLPVRKRDLVAARFSLAIALEILQVLIAIPLAWLRGQYPAEILKNEAGMDANIALFGLALGMLGVFNLVFFTSYYKHPEKVGKSFVLGSTAVATYMLLAEASAFAVPFMRDCIDTPDPQYWPYKLIFLAAGILVYVVLTAISYVRSARSFEQLDL